MPDTSQGRVTPLVVPPDGMRAPPRGGIVRRLTDAANYVIRGVTPQTWFGPMQPLEPFAPEATSRQWDYPTGINLNYVPRSTEGITFDMMRNLVRSCDVARLVVEARKDQIAALEWTIRVKASSDPLRRGMWQQKDVRRPGAADIPQETRQRIDNITQFLQYPDR